LGRREACVNDAANSAFDCGRRVYDSMQHRRWRLRVYQAREREWHRLAQQLAWGYTTARGKWSRGSPRTAPRHTQRPEAVVIGWGSASWEGSALSRRMLGPSKSFNRFMRANYSHFNVHILMVDEYCTSAVCTCCCRTDDKRGFSFSSRDGKKHFRPHKLQVCTKPNCKLVVDRDVSASIAIMARLLHMAVPDAPPGKLSNFDRRSGNQPAGQ